MFSPQNDVTPPNTGPVVYPYPTHRTTCIGCVCELEDVLGLMCLEKELTCAMEPARASFNDRWFGVQSSDLVYTS